MGLESKAHVESKWKSRTGPKKNINVGFSEVGSGSDVTSTRNIKDNLYHFLTFKYDGSDVKIYVDGLNVNFRT